MNQRDVLLQDKIIIEVAKRNALATCWDDQNSATIALGWFDEAVSWPRDSWPALSVLGTAQPAHSAPKFLPTTMLKSQQINANDLRESTVCTDSNITI